MFQPRNHMAQIWAGSIKKKHLAITTTSLWQTISQLLKQIKRLHTSTSTSNKEKDLAWIFKKEFFFLKPLDDVIMDFILLLVLAASTQTAIQTNSLCWLSWRQCDNRHTWKFVKFIQAIERLHQTLEIIMDSLQWFLEWGLPVRLMFSWTLMSSVYRPSSLESQWQWKKTPCESLSPVYTTIL